MTDHIWKRDEIESPCVKICVVHPDARICIGCYRTTQEISGWSRMSPEERKDLIEELPSRSSLLRNRNKGHRSRSRGSSS